MDTILVLLDSLLVAWLLAIACGEKSKIKYLFFFILLFAITEWKSVTFTDEIVSKYTVVYTVVPIIMMIMFISLVFNKCLLESFCLSLGSSVFIAVIQGVAVIVWYLVENILPISIDNDTRFVIMQIIYMLLSVILISLLKKRIYAICSYLQKWLTYKSRSKNIIRLSVYFSIVAIAMAGSCYIVYQDINNVSTFFYASVIILTTLVIVSIWYLETLKNTYEFEKLREQAKTQEIHNDFVQKVNKFSHSYNNLMQVLVYMLSFDECTKEDFQDIKEALRGIIKWNEENDLNYTLKYINIPSIVVSSVLSAKDKYAQSLGVTLTVHRQGNSLLTLNSKDCIDTLTILLDNAIQCACMTNNKEVLIDLNFGEKIFSCIISNEFVVDENNNVMKKAVNHGIGLKIIEALAKRNYRVSYKAWTEGNTYFAEFKHRNVVGEK